MLRDAAEALFSSNPSRRRSYRALLAWTVCTLLLMSGSLDSESYTWITMAFIGGEAMAKFASARSGGLGAIVDQPQGAERPYEDEYRDDVDLHRDEYAEQPTDGRGRR